MKNEAKRIAKIVHMELPALKKEFPQCNESALYEKLISKDLSSASEKLRNHIRNCSASIEGICYMIAMDMGGLRGYMKSRCLQFTKYMDNELYRYGFVPQSIATKKAVLLELELLIDGWEMWCQ